MTFTRSGLPGGTHPARDDDAALRAWRSGGSSAWDHDPPLRTAAMPSGVLREPEVETAMARVEPARGDDLATGEEVHALHAVGVGVAEQAVLPPAERVVRHRHRDRHI